MCLLNSSTVHVKFFKICATVRRKRVDVVYMKKFETFVSKCVRFQETKMVDYLPEGEKT